VPPMFLCHGAGTTALALSTLAAALADTGMFGEIFGISDSFLSSVNTTFGFDSIDEVALSMADLVVSALAAKSKSGKEVILGGWSYGGVVAYACTQVLLSRGIQVKFVMMVDSPLGQPEGKQLDGETQAALLGSMQGELADRVSAHFEACNKLLSMYRPSAIGCPVLDVRPPSSEVDFLLACDREALSTTWRRVTVDGASHFTLVQAPFSDTVAQMSAEALKDAKKSNESDRCPPISLQW